MNGKGKSDGFIVPEKSSNKAQITAAEVMEGRKPVKGNSIKRNASRTQSRADVHSSLEQVRRAAKKDKRQWFTVLFHHVYNIDRLRDAYYAVKRNAVSGLDGETWQHYGEKLEGNLQDLFLRLRSGAYLAKPIVRVYIPKADGRQRPIEFQYLKTKSFNEPWSRS